VSSSDVQAPPPISVFRMGTHEEGDLLTRSKKKTKRPKRFKVLLHNDDYTTMEFVVYILTKYFKKSHAEATHIMLHVHHKGVGVCGVYPRDQAETKVEQVLDDARANGMPLKCTTEPE
jgi:ATP-dependent Clp protease adaptor protein ClpS